MSSNSIGRQRELFLRGRALPPPEREAFLAEQCEGDAKLHSEVAVMLQADAAAGESETLPPVRGHAMPCGGRIGPYEFVEFIKAGGQGAVYKARQLNVDRTVAIKLIKPGYGDENFVRRFREEQRILSRMTDPHIATIIDAGQTPDGVRYLVMEYVPGKAITEFADEQKLSVHHRLRLFMQACQAVAHAHTRSIVHRDLKPSNILSYGLDKRARLKVIDFGIAKALGGAAMKVEAGTTQAGTAIGTLEYMSPEQAEGSPDIDTRTDIYSLGVVLYELLTGATPFSFDHTSLVDALTIIRNVDPPTPSQRLAASGAASAIAAARATTPEDLIAELRRELEWIPLCAMRKEPDRRYESVAELSKDIKNYLDGRPLIAAPDTRTYRIKKFVSRRRVPIAATAGLLFLLIAGITATGWALIGQHRQRVRAEELRMRADELRAQADRRAAEAQEARAAELLAKEYASREQDAAQAAKIAQSRAETRATAGQEQAAEALRKRAAELLAQEHALHEREEIAKAHAADLAALVKSKEASTQPSPARQPIAISARAAVPEYPFRAGPGKLKSAIELHGAFVQIADPADKHLELGAQATIEAWVWFDSVPRDGFAAIVGKDSGKGDKERWIFSYHSGSDTNATMLHVNSPGHGHAWLYSKAWKPQLGRWYHLAVSVQGTHCTFFRDGAPDGGATAPFILRRVNADLVLGAAEGAAFIDGAIDDVRIWNIARTGTQIRSSMGQELTGKEPGLVGYWPMDEARGTSVFDTTSYHTQGKYHTRLDVASEIVLHRDFVILGEGNAFWTNNINAPICKELLKLQKDHIFHSIAFTPKGDWVVLLGGNGYYTSNINLPACKKLTELQKGNVNFTSTAFAPNGAWTVLWNQNGMLTYDGDIGDAWNNMIEVSKGGGTYRSIIYGPHGEWVLLFDKTGIRWGNIPDDLGRVLGNAIKNGLTVRCVCFTTSGAWICLTNNGWWTSDLNHPASKMIAALYKEHKTLNWVAVAP